ncbi:hypothetical protein A6X21_06170 [Planctopirus hydrillae]|uniref:Uncharacterized protein n=1 Tax=Planctopirus hydrillae TaxID=1841610 RepID=A0A1C3EAE4_9PLAN|nr:hypothetical protein A6X21_06170 [Planctopirus hydrillae]
MTSPIVAEFPDNSVRFSYLLADRFPNGIISIQIGEQTFSVRQGVFPYGPALRSDARSAAWFGIRPLCGLAEFLFAL